MEKAAFNILDNEELISITRWHLDKGQFGDALIYIKHALTRNDSPIEAYRLGGKIYAQLGLFDHAKNAFKTYLDSAPEAVTELFQYGMVHFDSGDDERAISIWNDVLNKDATYPPALFYSALALANQNKTKDANKLLDVLIKSAPSDNLYFERGRELIRTIEQNQTTKIDKNDTKDKRSLDKYSSEDDRTIN